MTDLYPLRPQLYTHVRPSPETARAFAELALIDAVRHGLIVASVRRDRAGVYHWLDRVEAQVNAQRATVLKQLEGTGVMYAAIDGHVIALPYDGAMGAA